MALRVDKTLSDTSSQMEKITNERWKPRIPGFNRGGPSRPHRHRTGEGFSPTHVQEVKVSDKQQSGCKKTVTMAPVSRYMTDKSLYTMRKPLISLTPCQMPILKTSVTNKDPEQVPHINQADPSKEKEKSAENKILKSITDVSYTFSPPMSSDDLDTSMSILDLRLSPCDEEPVFDTSYNNHSLFSPSSAVLSLTVPSVPELSTPLSISQSTSRFTRNVKTRPGETDRGRDSLFNTRSYQYHSKIHPQGLKHMSPYQANYWACAIPNSMPPSPDRISPSWDPEKEYQALLDYTYPLRSNLANKWSSSESVLQTDPVLQDSGIELDHLYSSSTLSYLDQSQTRTQQGWYSSATGQRSTEFQGLNLRKPSHSKSSDGILSSSLDSLLDQAGTSGDSLDFDRKSRVHYRKFGIFSTSRSSPTFMSSTCILPRANSHEELDEEFLRLPKQIEELNLLSQQLRDISAQMCEPIIASWESLGNEFTYVRSPKVQVEKWKLDLEKRGDEADWGSCSQDHLKAEDHLEETKEPGTRMQMSAQELNKRNLREVETIRDQLSRISMSEFQRTIIKNQDEEEPKESLLKHIQAFCSNLENLIQWLYKVVEKIEVLSPPTVDLESVKASLADYKSFQEEVHAYKPLTADVLQTGEMLLHCMSSASPFLKETLALIERQSRTLETHSEYLFSSILSAMDSLTDPSTQEVSERIS